MPLWTLDTPPTWFKQAELTKEGWLDHATGELLVVMRGEENRVGPGTDLQRSQRGSTRIQTNHLLVQPGNASIRVTAVRPQIGHTRFQTTVAYSTNGIAKIQATTSRTQTGRTSVRNTLQRITAGRASLRVTQQRTITGSAVVLHKLPFKSLVEYGFYEGTNPLVITDLSGEGNHGTLSAPASYTNLGLRLDGTQQITIPDTSLPLANFPFTVFMVVQPEYLPSTSSNNYYFQTGPQNTPYPPGILLWSEPLNGLAVYIQNGGSNSKYYPKRNTPFSMVVRYDPAGQIDYRIAENSPVATNVLVVDTSHGVPIQANGFTSNGVIGHQLEGTLVYFCLFDNSISNGEVGELFKFAYDMLLARGSDPLITSSFGNGAFQGGAFQ